MTDLFKEPDDATPLEPQEREGLLQSWITYRRDLNEAEQENIVQGAAWARGRRRISIDSLLTDDFMRTLHKRMFGDVWRWAGTYRTTERNIGVAAYRIPLELINLLDDVRYWVDHQTYPRDEIAIRFHHRLVAIHPFPNGNGRHARQAADLLVGRLGGEPFSWGGGSLADVGELRARYVAALRAADNHDIGPLLEFARC
ncbi:cell division protein Fic [Ensifer adhaerens]|uniref:Cell division protein Fic n=1 Tax=Ensifer adhaerens TaxID=106592 RepID=A0A0L8BEI4_ENSAD|nr:mobile mystery protein B [Ensifer adhaerens]KOF12974.1 cell division protein Fic [Ensifer adhaerens]